MDTNMMMLAMYTGALVFILVSAAVGYFMDIESRGQFVLLQLAMFIVAVVLYFVQLGLGVAF